MRMQILRDLLFLTPNVLVVFTLVASLIGLFQMATGRPAPRRFWIALVLTTLLLPLVQRAWPHRYIAAYLPQFAFNSSLTYMGLALSILPALFATVGGLLYRKLPGYFLSFGGATYLLLVGIIMFFFNRGIIA